MEIYEVLEAQARQLLVTARELRQEKTSSSELSPNCSKPSAASL